VSRRLVMAGLLLVGPRPAAADVYFVQRTVATTDGRGGGAGVVSRVWYAGRKMRMEAGDVSPSPALVLRLDTKRAWRLHPKDRVAVAIDLSRLRARSIMDLSMAGELMGGPSATSVALPERHTMAGHSCRVWRVTSGSAEMDLCLTRELPVGMEAFSDFLDWSGAAESLGSLLAEVRRLKGFPLQTRARVSVLGRMQETVSTVTEVKVGPQPASLFEPPPGYRIVSEGPEP
jgi:Domain of unknown function (DUF4412)